MSSEPVPAKRFRVAFSFVGEKRGFLAQVAALLAQEFSRKKILYDKFHEAGFAQWKLGLNLPDLATLRECEGCPNRQSMTSRSFPQSRFRQVICAFFSWIEKWIKTNRKRTTKP